MSNTPIADLNVPLDLGDDGPICGGHRTVVDAGAFDHADGLEIVRRWNAYPDMLTALQDKADAFDHIALLMDDIDDPDGPVNTVKHAAEQAAEDLRAVIAKADL